MLGCGKGSLELSAFPGPVSCPCWSWLPASSWCRGSQELGSFQGHWLRDSELSDGAIGESSAVRPSTEVWVRAPSCYRGHLGAPGQNWVVS